MQKISDISVERAVLSGIYNYGGEVYDELKEILNADCFTLDTNQVIYKSLSHALEADPKTKLDVPTVLSAAKTLGLDSFLKEAEDTRHLRSIIQFPIEKDNVKKFAAQIRRLQVGRMYGGELTDILHKLETMTGEEPLEQIVGDIESRILDFGQKVNCTESSAIEDMSVGIREYMQFLAENPVNQIGISTGYKRLDKAIGGGLVAGLHVFGARPKNGKSWLGENLVLNIASQGIPVLRIETEMRKKEQWERSIGILSDVKVNLIKTGKYALDKEANRRAQIGINLYENLPYSFANVTGKEIDEIIAIMRRWLVTKVGFNEDGTAKPCVIVYDYLKLTTDDGLNKNVAEHQKLGFMMTKLHSFCVKYDVPIPMMCQLGRDGIDQEETNIIAASDRILWLCVSLTILKEMADTEMAEFGKLDKRYNRKLVNLASRHSGGLRRGEYISLFGDYGFGIDGTGKILEGPTNHEIRNMQDGFGKHADAEDKSY